MLLKPSHTGIPRSDRVTGDNRASRQVSSGAQVELCVLRWPPGFPAVPQHFNLSLVGPCPSQNRACAINAHGSSDGHSRSDRIGVLVTLSIPAALSSLSRLKLFSSSSSFIR